MFAVPASSFAPDHRAQMAEGAAAADIKPKIHAVRSDASSANHTFEYLPPGAGGRRRIRDFRHRAVWLHLLADRSIPDRAIRPNDQQATQRYRGLAWRTATGCDR